MYPKHKCYHRIKYTKFYVENVIKMQLHGNLKEKKRITLVLVIIHKTSQIPSKLH